jgi:hypothetical protein
VALLEKAIAANGADLATRYAGARSTSQGFFFDEGERIPLHSESIGDAEQRRSRTSTRYDYPDGAITQVEVINGSKGWISVDGEVSAMDSEELEESQAMLYLGSVESLVPLRDPKFSLALLPEVSVHGRAAVGIAVNWGWQPEVRLYFDKESMLLVKSQRRRKVSGERVNEEFYYSDYKFIQGVAISMKDVNVDNGKTVSEVTCTDYQFLEQLDDKMFHKPR